MNDDKINMCKSIIKTSENLDYLKRIRNILTNEICVCELSIGYKLFRKGYGDLPDRLDCEGIIEDGIDKYCLNLIKDVIVFSINLRIRECEIELGNL